MLELEYHTLARCESAESAIDAVAKLSPHQIPLRIRSGSVIRHAIEHIVLLTLGIDSDRCVFLSHLFFSQMIQAEVGHDAVDPGIERTFEAEVTHALVCLQERVLINVLRLVFRSAQ